MMTILFKTMKVLTFILFIGDPLLMAFVASVAIGAFFPNLKSKLTVKYIVCFSVFLMYFLLYSYAVITFDALWKNIVMFFPFALIVGVIIASVIVAPKDKMFEDKSDYEMTGFDSLFPNDIDKDKRH